MCLGEIVQLVEVAGDRAVGRRGDTDVDLSLITLETPVASGDWVITHSGFVLERLTADAAAQALALRQAPPHSSDPSDTPEERP